MDYMILSTYNFESRAINKFAFDLCIEGNAHVLICFCHSTCNVYPSAVYPVVKMHDRGEWESPYTSLKTYAISCSILHEMRHIPLFESPTTVVYILQFSAVTCMRLTIYAFRNAYKGNILWDAIYTYINIEDILPLLPDTKGSIFSRKRRVTTTHFSGLLSRETGSKEKLITKVHAVKITLELQLILVNDEDCWKIPRVLSPITRRFCVGKERKHLLCGAAVSRLFQASAAPPLLHISEQTSLLFRYASNWKQDWT